MLLIDTGFLVALTDAADPLSARARQWLQAIKEPAVLHHLVVVEFLNYFSATRFRSESHRLLDTLRHEAEVEIVFVDEALHSSALELHRSRQDKAWSLTDCASFIVMQQRGIRQAHVFDHHFEQAGFEAGLLRSDRATGR